jgi:hypothetical protein
MVALYFKALFALIVLILVGIGFFHVVAAEGWVNGFLFLVLSMVLPAVAATPVLLALDAIKAWTRKK